MGRFTRFAKQVSSFGRYDNFPSVIHGRVKIRYRTSVKKIYQIIVEALQRLNNSTIQSVLSVASQPNIQVGYTAFEVGIANGSYFDFLDRETAKQLTAIYQPMHEEKTPIVLDVIVVVSYRYLKRKEIIPLNSDHNIVRFIIKPKELYLYLFNAKGIRRLPLDKFFHNIIGKINDEMKKKRLKTFYIEAFDTT